MTRPSIAALVVAFFIVGLCRAEVKRVAIDAPTATAWVGQALVFNVELRSEGPFAGAASFSLPELPQCVIVKVGSPVVGTKEFDGDSWFVQTHQFALFSQRDGDIVIPPFEVRFSGKKDFQGPTTDHVAKTEPVALSIKRPDGAEADAFLVTTSDFTVTESWDPQPGAARTQPGAARHQPGAAEVGAIFHRTITQRADQMSGMALAPPSTAASDGVRVHPGAPDVSDDTQRGAFTGTRRDTITYVLQAPGALSVPAIKYVWWDPDKKEFGSTTLPAVTFDVTAPPATAAEAKPLPRRIPWIAVAVVGAALLGLIAGRRYLIDKWRRLRRVLNPPDRVAARHLLKACRTNDAHAAESAWLAWTATQQAGAPYPSALREAVTDLERHLYGDAKAAAWRGGRLGQTFRAYLTDNKPAPPASQFALPPLNP